MSSRALSQAQFHGTNTRLKKGDVIQPASAFGRSNSEGNQADHVHVSRNAEVAYGYAEEAARKHGGVPHVYHVNAEGPGVKDPSSYDQTATMHSAATIVKRASNDEHGWPSASEWRQQQKEDQASGWHD